jgi:hypothetical protein
VGVDPSPPGCAAPRLIPAGKAWLTIEMECDHDGTLFAATCSDDPSSGIRRFSVQDVFLDELQVTHACYASCVASGACVGLASTGDGDFSASATLEQVAQFCEWRGGRLPTVLELSRASHGELLHFTNLELYERVVACTAQGWDVTGCGALADHIAGAFAAGTFADDVGPFGHRDLFRGGGVTASAIERLDTACAYPHDAMDPGVIGDHPDLAHDPALRLEFTGGQDAYWILNNPNSPCYVGNANRFGTANDGDPAIVRQFRCAFDPVYVDDP